MLTGLLTGPGGSQLCRHTVNTRHVNALDTCICPVLLTSITATSVLPRHFRLSLTRKVLLSVAKQVSSLMEGQEHGSEGGVGEEWGLHQQGWARQEGERQG